MSNEDLPANIEQEFLPKPADMEAMAALGDFPRLMVGAGTSGFVNDGRGKLGEFFLEPDNALGKKMQVLVCQTRPHALITTDNGLKAQSFVQKSRTFKEIEHLARSKSAPDGEYPRFGPEFLLWTPEYGFFTFHMAKTMRRRSPSVLGIMGVKDGKYVPGWGEIHVETVKTQYTWHVAAGVKLAKPPKDYPEESEFKEAFEKFYRRVVDEVKAQAEDKSSDSDRDR